MDKQKFISDKVKELMAEGKDKNSSLAISYAMYNSEMKKMQQGGYVRNNLTTEQGNLVNKITNIEFTPEFLKSGYFQTEQEIQKPKAPPVQRPIVDMTGGDLYGGRKVWYGQKPEWYVGKQDPVEGVDYKSIPGKQWEEYKKSQEYLDYNMKQGGEKNSLWKNIRENRGSGRKPTKEMLEQEAKIKKMQQGGRPQLEPLNLFKPQGLQASTAFNPSLGDESNMYMMGDANLNGVVDEKDKIDRFGQPTASTTNTDKSFDRINIPNLYGGVNIPTAAYSLGQGIQTGNTLQTLGASAKLLTGLGRNILSGIGNEKVNQFVEDEYEQRQRDYKNKPTVLMQGGTFKDFMQQGGMKTNADLLTGNYITDQENYNTEIEDKEFVKDGQTGEVQEAVGEKHSNGGIKVSLADQSKVISDFTKIGAKNVKIFKEDLGIKVKASQTFADVMKKVNKSIGLEKLIEEESELIKQFEKIEKNPTENATQSINTEYIQEKLQQIQEDKKPLEEAQSILFEKVFEEQEKIPKKKSGEGVMMQEGGEMEQQITPQQIVEAFAQATQQDPNAIIEQLQQLSPEEQQQALSQMMQQLQMSSQEEEMMQQGGMVNKIGKDTLMDMEVGQKGVITEPTRTNLKPIYNIQSGVTNDKMGAGYYVYYKDPNKAGFNYDTDREYITTEAYRNQVVPSQQFRQYIKSSGGYLNTPAKMEEGGEIDFMQQGGNTTDSTKINTFTNDPSVLERLPYTPKEINMNSIFRGNSYENVWKPLVNQTMADPEKAKKVDEWLMANKGTFSPNVQKQLDSLTGQDRINRITQLATDGKPGLFHNAIEEAIKEVVVKPQEQATKPADQINSKSEEERVKNILPLFPENYIPMPSGNQPLYKASIDLGRVSPVFTSPEASLVNAESQRLAATSMNSGLSDTDRIANNFGTLVASQQAGNQAIMQAEGYNASAQERANLQNLQNYGKEQVFNVGQNLNYEQRALQGRNNTERDLRAYFAQNMAQNKQNFQDVANLNTLNANFDNYQTDGSNIIFNNRNPDFRVNAQAKALNEEAMAKYIKANPKAFEKFKKNNGYTS